MLTADAARIGAAELPGDPPTALVANLPYNVAVPVVLHLLAELPTLRRGLVMVQAEVADRMTAPPGSRVYGVPSVKLAWYADSRRAGPVPRTVFWPVPNVDSGLVAFTRRDPPDGGCAARRRVRGGGRRVLAAAQDPPRGAGHLGRVGRGRGTDPARGRGGPGGARRVAGGRRVRPDRRRPGGHLMITSMGCRIAPRIDRDHGRQAADRAVPDGSYDRGIVTAVTARVPAKVNLQLSVGPPGADGYHDLVTVFHALALFDEVTVTSADTDSVVVTGEGAGSVPLGPDNLAARAVAALVDAVGPGVRDAPGLAIEIRKRIPVAAGWPAAAPTQPGRWSPATSCGGPG